MFRDLFPVARHTPLNLIITPNGERLSVIVIPKPSGDAADNPALGKPLSFVGTPDDLDREFPEALRQYAEKVIDLRTALDLPLSELDAAKAKAAKKDAAKVEREKKAAEEAKTRSEAAKKAAETRAARAEEKRKAKEAADKKRAAARAAKKAEKSKTRITLPGATAPQSDKSKNVPTPRAGKPGKPECIADYKALYAQFGKELTRRGFIKQAKTGRRYEKVWKNWDEFIAEAGQLDLSLGQSTASEPSAPAPQAAASDDDALPIHGQGKGDSTDVYDEKLQYLSSITTSPAIGEHIGLVTHRHLLRVVKIDQRASGGLDLIVVPDPEETARRAAAPPPPPPLMNWTLRDLKSGADLPWTLTGQPAEDEVLEVSKGVRIKIVDVDTQAHVAIVKSVLTAAA